MVPDGEAKGDIVNAFARDTAATEVRLEETHARRDGGPRRRAARQGDRARVAVNAKNAESSLGEKDAEESGVAAEIDGAPRWRRVVE